MEDSAHIEVADDNWTKCPKPARRRRGANPNGKKTVIRRIVPNIGPLSRFDDGPAGRAGRLRRSFRDGRPPIGALLPYVGEDRPAECVVRRPDDDPVCAGMTLPLAPCVLDPAFSALGLDSLFATIKRAGKTECDPADVVRLPVCGGNLEPASKIATMRRNDGCFIPPVRKAGEFNACDAPSVIGANADRIFRRMNASSRGARGATRRSCSAT